MDAERQTQLINIVRYGVECEKDLMCIDDWIDYFHDEVITSEEYDWCRRNLKVHYKVMVTLK